MEKSIILKRTLALFAALAVSVFGLPLSAAAESSLSGEGTESSPFIISTADELLLLGSYDEVGYVSLAGDIDMSGKESLPYVIKKLTGEFNGNGHKISGLKLSGTEGTGAYNTAYTGFIGTLSGNISNLTLENIAVSTEKKNNSVGTLAGMAAAGKSIIENCIVTGSVDVAASSNTTTDYISGAIGIVYGEYTNKADVYINNCIFDVNVSAIENDWVAGVVARAYYNSNITISHCAVLDNIKAASSGFAGGMICQTTSSTNLNIDNSYFAGSMEGNTTKMYSIAFMVQKDTVNGGTLTYGENCFYISTAPKANSDSFLKTTITGSAEKKTEAELKNLKLSGFEVKEGEFGGFPVPTQKSAEGDSAENSISLDADKNAVITAANSGNVYIVFAEYDASGCLKNCEIVKESIPKGEKKTITSPQFFKAAAAENIKALLWSENLVPLAK